MVGVERCPVPLDLVDVPCIRGQDIDDFPHLKRWFEGIAVRPAVQRAYAKGEEINRNPTVTDQSKAILFGQGRRRD